MYFFAFLRLCLSCARAVMRLRLGLTLVQGDARGEVARPLRGPGACLLLKRCLQRMQVRCRAQWRARNHTYQLPVSACADSSTCATLHAAKRRCMRAVRTMLSALCSACERLPPNLLHPLLQPHGSALLIMWGQISGYIRLPLSKGRGGAAESR